MRKLIVAMSVVALVGLCVVVGYGQYFQPSTLDDYSWGTNPYLKVRPDIVRAGNPDDPGVWDVWMAAHQNSDGTLERPTEITLQDLEFLDVFLGNNDLAALWEQVSAYGPITDVLTLSSIRSLSLTRLDNLTKPEPGWAFSLTDILIIRGYFDLEMGTYDGRYPFRYVQ